MNTINQTTRVPKYRAWDKQGKEMIANANGYYFFRDYFDEDSHHCKSARDRFVVMQFTGLYDKNGKEICEGDIVGRKGVYCTKSGQPLSGHWKIIGGEVHKYTNGKTEERIMGYELFLVEWVTESCGFEPFSDSKYNCGHCGGGLDAQSIEIVGNIYDNPELFNPQDHESL